MAQSPSRSRKPRIRKSAPTIRQRVEAAQAEAEQPKKSRRIPLARLKNNRAVALAGRFTRPIRRVLARIVPRYFINSWREVRQVTWPSRRETWRLTGAVFIFALVFGAAVAVVDKGLDEIFKKVILK